MESKENKLVFNTPFSIGVILMLAASLSFSGMNIAVKMLKELPIMEIIAIRVLIQLALGSFALIKKKLNPFHGNQKLLLLRGLFGSAGLFFYFFTIQNLPLGNAVILYYLAPVFTTVLAIFLAKENVKNIQWFFFLISMIGVAIVNGISHDFKVLPVISGVIGAVFSGLAYNMIKKLKDKEDPDVVVFYFPLITLPIALLSYFIVPDGWRMPHGSEWLWLLATGVCTQLGQIFMTRAFQSDTASKISAVSYVGIIWALLFGSLLFNEHFTVLQYFGAALVLIGVVLNVRTKPN